MKIWLKGGITGAIVILAVLNFFMAYTLFYPKSTTTIWFIGILILPLYFIAKLIFNITLEGSWTQAASSGLLYTLTGFIIGAIIGLIIQKTKSK